MGKQKGLASPKFLTEAGFAPILIVILVVVLGIGGYFVYTSLRGQPTLSKVERVSISPSTSPSPTPDVTNNTLKSIVLSGPETRGSIITIADKKIKLSEDTFVDAYAANVLCVAGEPCPETPIYTLKRNNSTISFSVKSGKIVEESTAKDEDDAFDYIKKQL